MGIRFAKLHSGGLNFLVVHSLDGLGEEGKDLASMCRGPIGGAGLAVVRHRGLGRFDAGCYERDGSPVWLGGAIAPRMLACAAHTIRARYGLSRPLLIWNRLPHTAVVYGNWVCVTASPADGATSRWYSVTLVFEGEAVWPLSPTDYQLDCPWCEINSNH